MTVPADHKRVEAALLSAGHKITVLRSLTPTPEAFRVVNGRAVEALRFIPVTKD